MLIPALYTVVVLALLVSAIIVTSAVAKDALSEVIEPRLIIVEIPVLMNSRPCVTTALAAADQNASRQLTAYALRRQPEAGSIFRIKA